MKKLNKILALVLAFVMVAALLASCAPQVPTGTTPPTGNNDKTNPVNPGPGSGGDDPVPPTETVHDKYPKDGSVTLRMAFGYNSTDAAISFNANIIDKYGKEGVITLADGKEYRQGELKPTWVEMQNRLGIKFVDQYQGLSSSKEWEYWESQLEKVDVIYGGLQILNNAGMAGELYNLADYLDMMPSFKAYLEANPIVYLSITADPEKGSFYFAPYFDGANDIERMPLMRTDWVEKLLNGDGQFTASSSKTVTTGIYTPYMPTSGTVSIETVTADGTGTFTLTKDYSKYGNIVEKMNTAGSIDGVTAVNMLREYIDKTYDGYYGSNRANLFIGQDAAWDADELVALLRCIVANPQTINGTDKVDGIFARENNNNQRRVDMLKLAGVLFGVRGLQSCKDWLWADKDGNLHDARQEVDAYEAMDRMHAMALEGLISSSFLQEQEENTQKMLENDLGFMHYDYNQTQTLYNESGALQAGEKYMAVMVPVARWYDGTDPNGVYMRFTESWRSVKDSGIAITKKGVGGDENKLYAALAMIDYAYSKPGQILQSYGPDAFIKTNADGSYVTFNFNGEQWPEIADATREELWAKANGNYTNYARYFLGSTLTFLKSQSFEFQCTTEVGREGAGHLSTAIGLGTIKHPKLAITEDNYWYTNMPSALPIDEQQQSIIDSQVNLAGNSGKFATAKNYVNEFVDIIVNGYSGSVVSGVSNAAEAANQVKNEWGGSAYLAINQEAWEYALESFNG